MLTMLLISQISVSTLFSKSATFSNETFHKEIVSDPEFTIIEKLDVYPNPADDYIFVKLEKEVELEVKLEVMSFIGSKMNTSSEKIEKNLYKLNIRNIPSGHYYVMVSYGSTKELKKFLKQ
jgi:hypothetical protein